MPLAIARFAPLAILCASCTHAEPFPVVTEDDVTITLQRTACFGSCPDYTVTIDGKGDVRFATREAEGPGAAEVHRAFSPNDGVLISGVHTDRIDPQVVRGLVAKFRAADFFALKDKYVAQITDNPSYVLTLRIGTRSKTVVDYVGEKVGMPASVSALEDAVDRAAGTARWVEGADGLVDYLERTGFDFTTSAARDVALEAALGDVAADTTIIGLLERGAALDSPANYPFGSRKETLGKALTIAAVGAGRTSLFTWLAERGWVERTGSRALETAFADSSAGCSAALVHAFVTRGLAIDAPGDEGDTALSALASAYKCKGEDASVSLAAALLDAGADPNHRNDAGETAIFNVDYLPLLDLLYARGARADITDKEGNSAVFSSWTDAIVLRHLQAGASSTGRFYDGRTLEQQIKKRPMPRTKQWLKDNAKPPRYPSAP